MTETRSTVHTNTKETTDLTPGDRFLYRDVQTTILRHKEPATDRFGQHLFKFWARREDTGAEGYVVFGPGAFVTLI